MTTHCKHTMDADAYADRRGREDAKQERLEQATNDLCDEITAAIHHFPLLREFLERESDALWDYCLSCVKERFRELQEEEQLQRELGREERKMNSLMYG